MNTMRMAMEQSGNPMFAGAIARKRAEEKAMSARIARAEARRKRDAAIARIHSLSYSRNNKLVPRKKELRDQLETAKQEAKVYAFFARPERGYPAPPFRRDEEYPGGVNLPQTKRIDIVERSNEHKNLRVWLKILRSRNADEQVCHRVETHLEWLGMKIEKMKGNPVVRKNGRHSFALIPNSNVGKRRDVREFVVQNFSRN